MSPFLALPGRQAGGESHRKGGSSTWGAPTEPRVALGISRLSGPVIKTDPHAPATLVEARVDVAWTPIFGCVVAAVIGASSAFASAGKICIEPIHELASILDHDMPGGTPQRREPFYEFSVEVGNRHPGTIAVGGRSILVEGFDIAASIPVLIRDWDVVIESFRFRFEQRGSPFLCLRYTPWYQTWQLDPPPNRSDRCGCEFASDD